MKSEHIKRLTQSAVQSAQSGTVYIIGDITTDIVDMVKLTEHSARSIIDMHTDDIVHCDNSDHLVERAADDIIEQINSICDQVHVHDCTHIIVELCMFDVVDIYCIKSKHAFIKT